jgi:hypothetical protein
MDNKKLLDCPAVYECYDSECEVTDWKECNHLEHTNVKELPVIKCDCGKTITYNYSTNYPYDPYGKIVFYRLYGNLVGLKTSKGVHCFECADISKLIENKELDVTTWLVECPQ